MKQTVMVVLVLAVVIPSVCSQQVLPQPPRREEQRVYVPFTELDKVFDDSHQAVLIPYDDFLKLWGKLPLNLTPTPVPPPIEAALASARYQGVADSQAVRFSSSLTVNALASSWTKLTLGFGDVFVSSVASDPAGAVFSAGPDGMEVLLPKPGPYQLDIGFAVPISDTPDGSSFRLVLPHAPASSLVVTLPAPGATVRLEPEAAYQLSAVNERQTELSLPGGATGKLTVLWQGDTVSRTAREALYLAQSSVAAKLGERYLQARMWVDLDILRGQLTQFSVQLPAHVAVLDVRGTGIAEWQVAAAATGARIDVSLSDPLSGRYRLDIRAEVTEASDDGLPVPVPIVTGARRNVCTIGLVKPDSLRLVGVNGRGFTRITDDAVELPVEAGAQVLQHFRISGDEAAMSVMTEKYSPEVEIQGYQRVFISERDIDIDAAFRYTIARAELFGAELLLPADLEIREVGPGELVEDFQLSAADGNRQLTVRFRHGLTGQHMLRISGRQPRPTAAGTGSGASAGDRASGSTTVGASDLPLIYAVSSGRQDGFVAVGGLAKYALHEQAAQGLVPAPLRDLYATGQFQEGFGSLGYRYHFVPVSLRAGIETRATRITATAFHLIQAQEDHLQYQTVIEYLVQFAGVRTLTFHAPTALRDKLMVEGDGIKSKTPAASGQDGIDLWTVNLEGEIEGSYDLVLGYDQPLPQDQTPMTALQLHPADVEREKGFIQIQKVANLEVTADTSQLESVDQTEVPAPRRADAFLAYRYVTQPYSLTLNVIRHEYEPVIDTIVNRMYLQSVVSEEGMMSSDAVLQVQTRGRQYLELLLPEKSNILSLTVNGAAERPSVRETDGHLLIPMGQAMAGGGDREVLVRLFYETPLGSDMGAFGRLAPTGPEPLGIPVQKERWLLYVPENYVYLPPGGDMIWLERSHPTLWLAVKQAAIGAPGKAYSAGQGPAARDDLDLFAQAEAAGQTLSIKLVKQGRLYAFEKLHGTGRVTFAYLGRKLFGFIDFLLFALPLAAALYLLWKHIQLSRRQIWIPLGVAIVIYLMAGPFARGLLSSLILGLAAAVVLQEWPRIRQFIRRHWPKRARFIQIPPPPMAK